VRKFPLLRAERQLAQLQFHCGTPPPAAEPRIRICTAVKETGLPLGATFLSDRSLFAGVHVGRDFHAQADFFKFRFDPVHIFSLFDRMPKDNVLCFCFKDFLSFVF
jgi:hypothetical protein